MEKISHSAQQELIQQAKDLLIVRKSEKAYSCLFCKKDLDKTELTIHLIGHLNAKSQSCVICCCTAGPEEFLTDHLEEHVEDLWVEKNTSVFIAGDALLQVKNVIKVDLSDTDTAESGDAEPVISNVRSLADEMNADSQESLIQVHALAKDLGADSQETPRTPVTPGAVNGSNTAPDFSSSSQETDTCSEGQFSVRSMQSGVGYISSSSQSSESIDMSSGAIHRSSPDEVPKIVKNLIWTKNDLVEHAQTHLQNNTMDADNRQMYQKRKPQREAMIDLTGESSEMCIQNESFLQRACVKSAEQVLAEPRLCYTAPVNTMGALYYNTVPSLQTDVYPPIHMPSQPGLHSASGPIIRNLLTASPVQISVAAVPQNVMVSNAVNVSGSYPVAGSSLMAKYARRSVPLNISSSSVMYTTSASVMTGSKPRATHSATSIHKNMSPSNVVNETRPYPVTLVRSSMQSTEKTRFVITSQSMNTHNSYPLSLSNPKPIGVSVPNPANLSAPSARTSKKKSQVTEKPYHECSSCQKTFLHRPNLDEHFKEEHSGKPKYICANCKVVFKSASRLKQHMCHASFKDSQSLQTVVCQTADVAQSKPGRVLGDVTQWNALQNNSNIHVCNICRRTFTSATHLAQHAVAHSDNRPHSCPVCGTSFKMKMQLRKHITHYNHYC